jgi:hypothetical protein
MKSGKPSIKIIKRDERESASHGRPPNADKVEKEDSSSDLTGKATSTVAGWVREFQNRRREIRT